jgi:hypothetical protein
MSFCTQCGAPSQTGRFCSACGCAISEQRGRSSESAPPPPPQSNLLEDLKVLRVKSNILEEITATKHLDERLLGNVLLHFSRKFLCTNYRIISVSTMPLAGQELETRHGITVKMGGNFQIPLSSLSSVVCGASRLKKPHGGGHGKAQMIVKVVAPTIIKTIYPYEVNLIGQDSEVTNRFYAITAEQASRIVALVAKAGVKAMII